MKLKELLKSVDCGRLSETEIVDVTSDSRRVSQGVAFVCIKGPVNDGHMFAADAAEKGAAAVICERSVGLENEIVVNDSIAVFAEMCANRFGNPQKSIRLFGVTGTNGKTSVAFMLKSILEAAGHKSGLIGTIQNMIGDEVVRSVNTTPGIYDMYKLLSEMVGKGCDCCVSEVSSHALDQRRTEGLTYEVGMFTNLTEDHLDYHKTMEAYLQAKKKLFFASEKAVLNFDDPSFSAISEGIPSKVITYSCKSDEASYSAKNISYGADFTAFEFVGYNVIQRVKLGIGGSFTAANAMCALTAAISAGVDADTAVRGICSLGSVKGRCETVPTGLGYTVIIDYAHTPDGLENILKTFSSCPKNRLTVVFGCGGDRDKMKRPIMGEIASVYADNIIVTSDNPRTEDPNAIIEDILVGVKKGKKPYRVIENRIDAIKFAMENAEKGDIIVLAGKGHEDYQILADGKIHLDEREIIRDILNKKD